MKIKTIKKIDPYRFLSDLALSAIGLFSLAYIVFARRFAELHIELGFLDFPIFIGEILLFFCLIILAIKWSKQPVKLGIYHYLIFFYLIFILIKAFWGYSIWGPLSFRHAALFYYPLFAVFTYYFYRRDFFDRLTVLFISLLLIAILIPKSFTNFIFATILVAAILIKAYPQKKISFLLFLTLLVFIPYKNFFHTSRTMFICNIIVGMYLAISLFLLFRMKKAYRITIVIILLLFLSSVALKISKDENLKPLLSFRTLSDRYHQYLEQIAASKEDPSMRRAVTKNLENIKVQLYEVQAARDKRLKTIQLSDIEKMVVAERINQQQLKGAEAQLRKLKGKRKISSDDQGYQQQISQLHKETEALKDKLKVQHSAIAVAPKVGRIANVFFRLFVWRDALRQLKEEKAIFGIDFGKPFRSSSIEYLYWAVGDWSHDGWIAMHNSYFEIVYRAGILGILLVGVILGLLFRLMLRVTKLRSLSGILLCAALINWLAAANMLVILELPYTAIPFWSLFGVGLVSFKKPCLDSSKT